MFDAFEFFSLLQLFFFFFFQVVEAICTQAVV